MRQSLKHKIGLNKEFRFRGKEPTRVESFSDAVFALALTLLILSTEVPKTFEELKAIVGQVLPFGITITLFILIWYEHFRFFYRYGLMGANIVAINSLLLFFVLLYVYPLKFLFQYLSRLFYAIYTNDQSAFDELFSTVIKRSDTPDLMILYAVGVVLIFVTLAAMYWYAYIKRDELDLNEIEIFDTTSSIYQNLWMALPPFLSAMIAAFRIGGEAYTQIPAGFIYFLYPIVMPLSAVIREKKREKLLKKINDEDSNNRNG